MKQFLLYVFLFVALGAGLSSVFYPQAVVAFRRRKKFSEGLWSGGYFYATERRARVMGTLIALISLFGLVVTLARSH